MRAKKKAGASEERQSVASTQAGTLAQYCERVRAGVVVVALGT